MAYTIPSVEPAQNPTLAEIERKSGTNNLLRVMAHRPEAMQAFTNLYGSLMGPGATLDRRTKEMVYLAVSFVNECEYCGLHHRKEGLGAGLSDHEIREIEVETNEHFTAREQAVLLYARELTRTASVSDDLRYRVQELLSTGELVELTMLVGLANFTNRFNNGLAVPLDIPRHVG